MGYRVGIDVGGTFTDVVCVRPDGLVLLEKALSTPEDQSVGVLEALRRLAARLGTDLRSLCGDVDVLAHGSTVADNTMIEMNGARTGLLATEGHRDEIELRRCFKEQIWDPAYPPPPPIARRRARVGVRERLDADGRVVVPLSEQDVRAAARRLGRLGVESVAVAFLFSYLDPRHELRAREVLEEELPGLAHVSLSHEVLPRPPEFERTSTTLVNAYVAPRLERYLSRLTQALRDAGYEGELLLMQSTGGVMPPSYVAKHAVSLLASGPAAGVLGAARWADGIGLGDFVSADMGGTSYDICLVRGGEPQVSLDWNWRHRYYVGLPMVDVHAIGAGGGSIATVEAGALAVGPASAGSDPGPACYGRGGTLPTVTDADLVLGYLPARGFASGLMDLDPDAAWAAIERGVAKPLDLDVPAAASAIRRVVDSAMADALRRVLAARGADPRELALVAYGGSGPVHAWSQATELGISRVLVPRAAPAFSALGLLAAGYRLEAVRGFVGEASSADPEGVRRRFQEMEAEARRALQTARLSPSEVLLEGFANMCYPGQNFDVSVPFPEALGAQVDGEALRGLARRFHELHEADRGFAFLDHEPLVRSLRLVATAACSAVSGTAALHATPLVPGSGRTGRERQRALFADRFVEVPVHQGSDLDDGAVVRGPALIDEPFTVIVVPPGCCARVHRGYVELVAG
jgi:N-methylhydantoinase A